MSKTVIISQHAEMQMLLRGTNESEVLKTIEQGQWIPAKYDRFQSKLRFDFDKPSPINGITYRFKDVEPIFKEENDYILVITVKVYYSDKSEV
ncbi:MAG: DUF4258 domain-containing protein [Candidatus Poribacteria bacterium]